VGGDHVNPLCFRFKNGNIKVGQDGLTQKSILQIKLILVIVPMGGQEEETRNGTRS
jgi:hypothetical protein